VKRKLIATLLRNINFLNFTIMARNTKPDYKSVECNFDIQKDFERTKPNLGLTPQQVADMAKRGIPVRQ